MFKIKITTYEQDRLEHFTNLMKGTQKTYNRFYKKFKDAPYLSAEARALSDAGRELQFYKDVVEMLENGCRKQEWISVEDRLPEDSMTVITCNAKGEVDADYYAAYSLGFSDKTVTHWMPLPEPPKMKGGAE